LSRFRTAQRNSYDAHIYALQTLFNRGNSISDIVM